jgi:quinol monooxygenase YgiN
MSESQTQAPIRAVAVLTANPGQEQELADYVLSTLPQIRQAEGLDAVEFSRSLTDAGKMVLYYWWRSAAASERYIAGPIYAKIGPSLHRLVADRILIVGELQPAARK